jgi:predicted nucleotidyltransferase
MFGELFGGASRLKVLRLLYAEPSKSYALREMAAAAGVDHAHLIRLLRRWVAVGLVERFEEPRHVLYRAARDPALLPLIQLFRTDSDLIARLRAKVPAGAEYAGVFGSYARGEESVDSDVDVLIVGPISELRANAALAPVARQFGRPVNATAMTRERFQKALKQRDSFVISLVDSPRIDLKGTFDEISKS